MPTFLSGRRFAPVLHWTALALLGVALFASFGRWQLGRAEEKRVLFAGFAAGSVDVIDLPAGLAPVERYHRVTVRGRYDTSRQFLLDNMTHNGVPGYHVLTPLLREDDGIVLVDRGFIPLAASRSSLPDVSVGTAARSVTGRADSLPRAAITLEAPPGSGWPRVVSFPEMKQLGATLGTEAHPQVLLLDAVEPDGYLREWRPPGMTPDKHIGYAVQWFGLAAAVVVTWFVLSLKPAEASQ